MNLTSSMIFGALMLTCITAHGPFAWAAGDTIAQAPSSNSGYRVGDKLAPAKSRTPAGEYEDILWETLLPEGWSVEKELRSLDLNALEDNDPKARDVMKKIREMWDQAPTNPKLDNKRVRIPGFVVPLDGEREKTREFLLVPYFGACIHAPAPPANQIIHVVVSTKNATTLTPAAWISGTIRIARSDTTLGVTGYEMTVDKVEPYKQEDMLPI